MPIAGVFASWSHATNPNEFPSETLRTGLWWTTATPRTPGRGVELGQHLARDRRYLRGSGTVRRREAAERLGEGVLPGASSSGAADGGDGAERPDQGARDEEGDHEPTDEPEGRFGIVEEPAAGDERGGATGPLRHESGTSGREPRSGENQPHDKEHEAHEQLEKLATIAARLAVPRRSTRARRCRRGAG